MYGDRCSGVLGKGCGSYAINDDPERKLCDRCWRDVQIEDLKVGVKRLCAVESERARLRAAIEKYVASRAFQGVCDEECELEAALKETEL